MKYLKIFIVLVSCISIVSCADGVVDCTEMQLRSTDNIIQMRGIRYPRKPISTTCDHEGFETEIEAITSLRSAGVCPLQIELKSNPNDQSYFPCTAFGSYYFYALIPVTQLKLAVDAGWDDPYSESNINNHIEVREFLLEKHAEYFVEQPACDCSDEQTVAACSMELQKECIDYDVSKIFRKEAQVEIDSVNEYLLKAGEATGEVY